MICQRDIYMSIAGCYEIRNLYRRLAIAKSVTFLAFFQLHGLLVHFGGVGAFCFLLFEIYLTKAG